MQHVTTTRTGLSVRLDAFGTGIVCPIQVGYIQAASIHGQAFWSVGLLSPVQSAPLEHFVCIRILEAKIHFQVAMVPRRGPFSEHNPRDDDSFRLQPFSLPGM